MRRNPLRNRKIKKKSRRPEKQELTLSGSLQLHAEIVVLTRKIQDYEKKLEEAQDRIQDLEIHVNLLTRLLTSLCIDKFKIRMGVLKKMIKQIEEEALWDNQIQHLESIYNMPAHHDEPKDKKTDSKKDPWEEIS